jgi:hypothetical protein
MDSTTETRRDWNFDRDGQLIGQYVETRPVTIRNGPAAGKQKIVFDFHVGDETISVFETSVIKSKLRDELNKRGAGDFEPDETITITPTGTKTGASGYDYRDFDVDFEHKAPKRSTADLLAVADGDADPGPEEDPNDPGPEPDLAADHDDDIPF